MSELQAFPQRGARLARRKLPPIDAHPHPGRRSGVGRTPGKRFKNLESKLWLDRMAQRGWTTPRWPREYGGGGLSFEEDRVLQQELARIRAGCRSTVSASGCWARHCWSSPTNSRSRNTCRPSRTAQSAGARGYSEPGQGSDLAALQTKAEDKGDHYLVNGSKIWTSYANHADWIFCLVRTDANAPKHQRHQLSAVRHGLTRGFHIPHRTHQRLIAVLPDLLRQCAGAPSAIWSAR